MARRPSLAIRYSLFAIRYSLFAIRYSLFAIRLHPAQPAHDLPLLRRHRLHRQARLLGEHHVLEPFVRLHARERHRLFQRLARLDVDRHEHALLVGRIRIGLADHLDDADDLLLVAGVIEEREVAFLHRLEVLAGAEVAHAGPRLPLGALLDLIVP